MDLDKIKLVLQDKLLIEQFLSELGGEISCYVANSGKSVDSFRFKITTAGIGGAISNKLYKHGRDVLHATGRVPWYRLYPNLGTAAVNSAFDGTRFTIENWNTLFGKSTIAGFYKDGGGAINLEDVYKLPKRNPQNRVVFPMNDVIITPNQQ